MKPPIWGTKFHAERPDREHRSQGDTQHRRDPEHHESVDHRHERGPGEIATDRPVRRISQPDGLPARAHRDPPFNGRGQPRAVHEERDSEDQRPRGAEQAGTERRQHVRKIPTAPEALRQVLHLICEPHRRFTILEPGSDDGKGRQVVGDRRNLRTQLGRGLRTACHCEHGGRPDDGQTRDTDDSDRDEAWNPGASLHPRHRSMQRHGDEDRHHDRHRHRCHRREPDPQQCAPDHGAEHCECPAPARCKAHTRRRGGDDRIETSTRVT